MRPTLFLTMSALPVAVLALLAACGGSAPPAEAPPAAPPAGSSTPATADTAAGAATTTTMTLGDAGDLQGAKLTTSSTSGVHETAAADAGPGKGPHAQEPGRAVKDIQTIVQAHRDEARACYDGALKTHPGIEGNLDVKWTIDPTGKVTDAAVDESKSDIHEPGVGKCIIEILQKISFSVSAKGFETRAHYPFNFHPRGGTAPKP
jgi:hypothetical protein